MIRPNVPCQIQSIASRDLYGEETLSPAKKAMCNVVRIVIRSERTSVRADSSASRGAAEELVSTSRLLFLPSVSLSIGDKITVAGADLKVETIQPRFTVNGKHDHNEVDLTIWA